MTRLQAQLRDRLLDALERRGMTQAALARKAGVSTKHLNRLLRSDEIEGSLTMWQELFDVLGFRVDVKIVRKPKVEL